MKLSDRGKAMPASPIRKLAPVADAAKKRGVKVYHLNIGQPDIETPPEIFNAISNYHDKVLSYGPSGGLAELRLAVKEYFDDCAIRLEIDHIWITTGGSEAISFALMTVCDPGDEVIVFEPFYTNYNGFAIAAGITLVPIATSVKDGFRPPIRELILKKISKRTHAIIICSPNNPTGTVYTQEELFIISKICREHNLFLISDEVYREFIYDTKVHTSALSLPKMDDRVIVVDSISKRFSACGARIGYLVSRNQQVMDTVLRFAQARLCPPTLEQIGAIAAFKSMHRYIKPMIREYELRRNTLFAGLSQIEGVVLHKPEGAFYMMPKLPVDDTEKFSRWLLEEFSLDNKTVMLAPASGFYASKRRGHDEVRIAYVLKQDDLIDAVKLLQQAIKDYNR
jgi:aspartate aminotransferase